MQQVQIADESLYHLWKASTRGYWTYRIFTGNTCFEDLTKSILNYFASIYPTTAERSFGISVIKHCHCTLCDIEDTYHEYELLIDTIKPVNSYRYRYVKSNTKSECSKQLTFVEESDISCGKTNIVINCIDILQQETFKANNVIVQTIDIYIFI